MLLLDTNALSEGDASALEALVARHWAPSYRLALAILGDPGAAEGVAQRAFVELVALSRARKKLGPFEGRLHAVVVSHALSALRSRKRRLRNEEIAALRARLAGDLVSFEALASRALDVRDAPAPPVPDTRALLEARPPRRLDVARHLLLPGLLVTAALWLVAWALGALTFFPEIPPEPETPGAATLTPK